MKISISQPAEHTAPAFIQAVSVAISGLRTEILDEFAVISGFGFGILSLSAVVSSRCPTNMKRIAALSINMK